MRIKKLILPALMSDDECKSLVGQHVSSEYITEYIDYSVDIYNTEGQLLCKFRKNVIDPQIAQVGWNNYRTLAKASRTRGASAGMIDPTSKYWSKRQLVDTNKWSTGYMVNGKESKMKCNNQVASQALGYYEQTKGIKQLPCRLTTFTKMHYDKYQAGLPYIHALNDRYKQLNYPKWKEQHNRAKIKKEFRIDNTAFSTITINRNFRTAVHKDAGDYGGWAVLSVLERGQYNGGCFMMPKYGIGIDMRHGDVLVADVHQYHCNSEMWTTLEQDEYNSSLKDIFKDNVEVGTDGLDKKYTRLSFVCYLREKLVECKL